MPPFAHGPQPVARPSLAYFVALALGITWTLQLPAWLAKEQLIAGPAERYLPLAALGGFGPLVAVVQAARREAGAAGLRAVFASMRPERRLAFFYVFALLLFPLVHLVGAMGVRPFAGPESIAWVYPPENGPQWVAMVIVPLVEEPAWRGFALPRLEGRFGLLGASLVLGAVWAAWHVLMFSLQGMEPAAFAIALANILAGSVVFAWLYRRTGGSLLAAVLAHMGAHASNPTHSLATSLVPFATYTLAIGLLAIGLVAFDHETFRPRVPSAE